MAFLTAQTNTYSHSEIQNFDGVIKAYDFAFLISEMERISILLITLQMKFIQC